MLYLLVFFSSLIITIISTPFLINFLTRLNIVDFPGGRRINTYAIPRMGGILIYTMVVLALLNYTKDFYVFRFVIISSGLLAVCGILDDLRSLGWKNKFLLHSMSAIIIIFYIYPISSGIEFFGTLLPYPFDIVVLFFLITGSVNALNMLDGMDGLVSGFSLLLFMLIFILSFSIADPFLMILSAASIGSLIGFLKFNASPARIFLGDTGSLILGFFLVISALLFTHGFYRGRLDLGFAIILLGVPLIDTLRVMAIRIWNGRSPFTADKNHIHHLISGNNIRHKTTVFIIQAFTVSHISFSLIYLYYDKFTGYFLFCISAVILFHLSTLINLMKKAVRIKDFLARYSGGDIFTIDLYRKYLLPFSALTVAALIFIMFPSRIELPPDVLILMVVICGLLFAASYISSRRERSFSDVYVLMNLLIFFSLSNLSSPLSGTHPGWGSRIILYLSAVSVLGITALFFVTRKSVFGGKSLLSGMDMIILILLIFLMIVHNMVYVKGMEFMGGNLILGFTTYIWYKIAMYIMPRYLKPVYYLTFILPLLALIVIWM